MEYHVISAKRMGWEQMYDYFFFPVIEFTKESALAQFKEVKRQAWKNNDYYPYTAYQYGDELFYSILYSGIVDEDENSD